MAVQLITKPIEVTQDIIYNSENETLFINTTISTTAIIRVAAKNIILCSQAYIEAREVHVTCSGTFVTIGIIDTSHQYITASKVYIGGWSTTEEEAIEVEADEYPTFGRETAIAELERIARQFYRPETLPSLC